MLDSYFSTDDRNRIQALKKQLTWKCTNYHQGERFRIVVNTFKKTHTIYFPKDTSKNPTLYNYLLELSRAFYAEKYGPVFGDVYFHPETDKRVLSLFSSLVHVSQHWFTGIFCHANFPLVWEQTLDIKYKAISENPQVITETPHQTFSAALVIAQLALIRKQDTSSLVNGSLRDMVNHFVRIDPHAVSVPQVASLVNGLIDLFKPGATLGFKAHNEGGFWELSS